MAGGIFALLDDIAMLMDDAAALTKVAVKKTAGILGDDLAVNAEKATGSHSSRELAVIWAIAKGSFFNKIIILPLAFLLSAFLPGLLVPILLLGGLYLCFEGAEKISHFLFHKPNTSKAETLLALSPNEMLALEKGKIRSAILTDFILSLEIIMIALGTVLEQSLGMQILVVSVIALLATIGVYGLVALLVRMDDLGLWLVGRGKSWGIAFGNFLINLMPRLIQGLSIVGVIAMFLVGGSMFIHHIEFIHHLTEKLPTLLAELLVGLEVGGHAVLIFQGGKAVVKRLKPS